MTPPPNLAKCLVAIPQCPHEPEIPGSMLGKLTEGGKRSSTAGGGGGGGGGGGEGGKRWREGGSSKGEGGKE